MKFLKMYVIRKSVMKTHTVVSLFYKMISSNLKCTFLRIIIFNSLRQGNDLINEWYVKIRRAPADCEMVIQNMFVTTVKKVI